MRHFILLSLSIVLAGCFFPTEEPYPEPHLPAVTVNIEASHWRTAPNGDEIASITGGFSSGVDSLQGVELNGVALARRTYPADTATVSAPIYADSSENRFTLIYPHSRVTRSVRVACSAPEIASPVPGTVLSRDSLLFISATVSSHYDSWSVVTVGDLLHQEIHSEYEPSTVFAFDGMSSLVGPVCRIAVKTQISGFDSAKSPMVQLYLTQSRIVDYSLR